MSTEAEESPLLGSLTKERPVEIRAEKTSVCYRDSCSVVMGYKRSINPIIYPNPVSSD